MNGFFSLSTWQTTMFCTQNTIGNDAGHQLRLQIIITACSYKTKIPTTKSPFHPRGVVRKSGRKQKSIDYNHTATDDLFNWFMTVGGRKNTRQDFNWRCFMFFVAVEHPNWGLAISDTRYRNTCWVFSIQGSIDVYRKSAWVNCFNCDTWWTSFQNSTVIVTPWFFNP